jgi:tetratricopeptide (TPR) repeat protein
MASALQRLLGDPANFPLAPAEAGDFYLSIGRPAEALSQYEAGLKSSAKDKLPYQKRIANLMINTGRGAEAMPILEEILKQNPADEEALSVRASQWLNSGKPEELDRALTEFQALVKKSPSNAVFHFNLGRAYQLKGRNQEARAEFLESLRLRPAEMQPRFALADLALRTGRTEEAIRYADEILTLIPGQPRARLLRSAGLLNAGNPVEARSELRRLIAEFPQYRDAYLQLAMVAIAEKKFAEAETLLRQSEQLPGGADPRFAAILAESFASQNRAEDALRTLEEAVRKTPDSPLLRSQLASAAARAGHYDAAIEQFQWILERNPNALNAQVGLGEVYGLKGDAAKAVERLRKARDMAPHLVEVHLLLGTQLENARQFDEAKEAYRQALRVQPDNLIALNNLASLIAETGGSLEEALQLAQRAVAKAPKQDPVPTDTLGWIYLKKGMADTARQIFANLVKTHPDNAVFRYHFGATLLQQGDRAGARTELEAALQRQPSADIEKKTKELLAKL